MSLTILLVSVAGFILATVVLQAALLWLACRLVRIGRVQFRRALVVVIVISVAATGVGFPAAWIQTQPVGIGFGDEFVLFVILAVFVVQIVVVGVIMRAFFDTGFWRAVAAWFISYIPAVAISIASLLAVRAVAIELFVVPTGGVAPTIIGVHSDVTCENCGHEFAIGMSERIADVDDPPFRHVDDKTARCTFCGHNNLVKKDVSVQSGDRIIVDKTAAPKRWELIAFRVPQRPGAGPSDASEIFVKRLVGMPGETIAISGGDLFVGGMRLQKTPATQLDLWFAAHDTRYVPKTIVETTPRWTRDEGSSGWTSKGPAWQFDGHDADAGVLRFSGSVTDRYDYNADSSLSMVRPAEEINLVSDVRIRLPIRSLEGSGNLTVRWRHNGRSADATVDAGGDVTLTDGDRSERGTVATPFSPQSPVAFAYRDGLAYVTDGEKVVVKLNVGTTDLLSEKRDRSPVRLEIVGRQCKATIDWITIDRDVYYIDGGTLTRVFGEPTEDDSPRDYTLGADEFFVLGDNSPRSLDSRFYTGPITRDRIVGVARWRYWPPARWREFR